jgi:hypothetical protein
MFIIEDEKRNKACKDLERKFAERFVGLQLIWSEIDRNSREVQKFTLKEAISGQKLRLVFITNGSFANDEMGSFLSKFEDRFEEFMAIGMHDLKFEKGKFVIQEK